MSRLLRRTPISVRLAALFTALFLAVLGALAGVVYVQLGLALRAGVDQGLVNQAASITERLRADGADGADEGAADDASIAGLEPSEQAVQLIASDGTVLDAAGDAPGGRPLLPPAALGRVLGGEPVLQTVPGDEDGLRVLGVAAPDAAPVAAVVVAAELDRVSEPQAAFLAVLVPAGIVAALAAGGLGWAVARRGLRPIDRMVAEAAAINAGALQRRLPVPTTRDEVARLGTTLNAMLERLTTAIERQREFTADASHELRTPLAILRTQVELLRDRAAEPDLRAALDSSLEEVDRLGLLVEDLLVLARADADRMDITEPVDLGDLAALVARRFRVVADREGLELTAHGAAVVRGDRRGLERALSNLLDNAVRHTPAGGRVEVHTGPDGAGARVTVTDTGPGVDPRLADRLFDRFTRADPARTRGGAGLGLAIVAAVVQAHGGSVTAHNVAEGGLRVDVSLP